MRRQKQAFIQAKRACEKSKPHGFVDFFIDGELCLSEPIAQSWGDDGTPKKAGEKADAQKRKHESKAVAALHDEWSQTGHPHRSYNEDTGCVDIDSDAEREAESKVKRAAVHGQPECPTCKHLQKVMKNAKTLCWRHDLESRGLNPKHLA